MGIIHESTNRIHAHFVAACVVCADFPPPRIPFDLTSAHRMSWLVNLGTGSKPNWRPYPPADNAIIEAAYVDGEVEVELNASYAIDFVLKRQIRRDDNSRKREIK